MLSSLLITLREGLEAALIVSIIAAFLVRSGERKHMRALWAGVAAAVIGSALFGGIIAAGGAALSDEAQEIYEGVAGLIAVAVLTWMIFFMRRHARAQKSELESSAARAVESGHPRAVMLLAFAAVAREGLETVLFLNASFNSSTSSAESAAGAVIGLLIAIALGFGIYRGGIKLNLRTFFTVTGAVLIVVAAGLLSTSLHEFEEAGVLTWLSAHAWDTGGFISKTGFAGSVLRGLIGYDADPSWLQVIAYWVYLVPTMTLFLTPILKSRRGTFDRRPQAARAS